MDIKQEPEEIINPDAQYNTQWQHYKNEFEETEFKIEIEEHDAKNNTNIQAKSSFQEPFLGFEKIKNEVEFVCEKNVLQNILPLKADESNSESIFSGGKRLTPERQSVNHRISGKHSLINDKASMKTYSSSEHSFKCTNFGDMDDRINGDSVKKPFKCEDCDYVCRHFCSLKKHKLVHSAKKPFHCDVCFYICRRSSDLTRHKKIHSGEKPFKCDECEYTCKLPGYLRKHKLRHSEEEYKIKKPPMNLENKKSKKDTICDGNNENIFGNKIKTSKAGQVSSKGELLTSKSNTKLSSFCSDDIQDATRFEPVTENSEVDIKKDFMNLEIINKTDASKFSVNQNRWQNIQFPELIARISLIRILFYKKNFVCSVCYDIFATAAEKELHTLKHRSSTSRIEKYTSGEQHYSKHELYKKMPVSSNHRNMETYKQDITRENIFKYVDCKFACQELRKLRRHERSRLVEKPLKYEECNYSCMQSGNMKKHKMIHAGKKFFNCVQCDYSCIQSCDMKKYKMIHSGEKLFKCDVCDYSCSLHVKLKYHKMKHSGEKRFKCDICEYSCIYSNQMKSHKAKHSGEKQLKCEECDYACVQTCSMKKHKMIHSGEKPFKCDKCNFTCRSFGPLKLHKMIHSGEKPFKCDECDYATIHSGNLRVHKKKHSKRKLLYDTYIRKYNK